MRQPGAVQASQAHKLGHVEGKNAEGDEEDTPTDAHTQHNESRVQAHTRAHTRSQAYRHGVLTTAIYASNREREREREGRGEREETYNY